MFLLGQIRFPKMYMKIIFGYDEIFPHKFVCITYYLSLSLHSHRMTFIADERFQAFFKEETKQWVLQIKYVVPRDVGLYECQVSTEPKVSARAYLHVVGKCSNNTAFN